MIIDKITSNILVSGCLGQLGSELKLLLGNNENIFFIDQKELDITNEFKVKTFLNKNKIDLVINCAAYTAVDQAEDDFILVNAVNHLGAKYLAKYSKNIIHISTDYVFDGLHHTPYVETDKVNPISVYGKSKLLGEQAVLNEAQSAIIIRTAWLYSSFGRNFVKTMLSLGLSKKELSVVSDQVGTPTYAKDLAQAIVQILPQIKPNQKGIYHFTNEGVCSWYDFALAIMEEAKLPCQIKPIETWQYQTKAMRPPYSILNKNKIKADFNVNIRHWRQALRDCLAQIQKEDKK